MTFDDEMIVEDDARYVMKQRGVIVAHDKNALREYKRYARKQKEKFQEINTLRTEVNDIKSDVSDIKSMLTELLQKDKE